MKSKENADQEYSVDEYRKRRKEKERERNRYLNLTFSTFSFETLKVLQHFLVYFCDVLLYKIAITFITNQFVLAMLRRKLLSGIIAIVHSIGSQPCFSPAPLKIVPSDITPPVFPTLSRMKDVESY